jgi:hypothetical protein
MDQKGTWNASKASKDPLEDDAYPRVHEIRPLRAPAGPLARLGR